MFSLKYKKTLSLNYSCYPFFTEAQGPVVQSIVSLANSLRGQLAKCFITKYTNIFFQKSERSFCDAKASHNFSTKNVGAFEILMFEILTKR